jgi:arylsulfatase A-like enzyme
MVDFIAELKRLGRYQESMIVIQSDHTWDLKTEIPARDRGSAERLRDNLWRVDPAVIDSLTRALLLVKPPGRASVPLEISARAAQLVDIPATIYEAVGMVPRTQPPHGRSLLSADFPADREVHVFVGYRQTDEHGRFLFLGRDFDAGELNHFSYQESGGWKRYANRLVKW